MKNHVLITTILLSFWGHSQGNTSFFNIKTEDFPHTNYLGSESVNPFIINQIQVSLNTRIKPMYSMVLKCNSGNAMVHNTILQNVDGAALEIAYDAVFEKDALQFTFPIHVNFEGMIEVGFNSSSEKGLLNPMNWMVADNFIENFHAVMGKGDIYNRKALGFNHYTSKTVNEKGKKVELKQKAIYSKPVIIGATHYFKLKNHDDRITSLNTSLFMKFPLESITTKKLETGLGVNLSSTKKTGKKTSFTSAFHSSIYYHGKATSHNYASHERKFSYKMTGLLGLNFHNKKNDNKYSLFFSLNKTTSRLKAKYYSTTGNEFNVQALKAATDGNAYFEIGGNYTFSFKNKKKLTLELTIREDFDSDLRQLDNLLDGSNSEDFGVFIGLRFSIL